MTRVLIAQGHVILSGLEFATGADDLQDGLYPQLDDLADFLNGDAARRVMLVGHTDSEGSLAANTALSRRRAQSVARRLVERHGAPRGQISAQGAGFLAPVASNLIPDGREANRRVEVILLGME